MDDLQNLPLSIPEIRLLCSMVDSGIMHLEQSYKKTKDPLEKGISEAYITQAKGIRAKLSQMGGAYK